MNIHDPELRAKVTGLLGYDLFGEMLGGFRRVELAEEAILKAQAAHPETADLLWHAFPLLTWTHERMETNERLFQAHMRELLERVAAGEDTRPGTAAEVCIVFSEVSPHHHLIEAGNALYARLFCQIYPAEGQEIWGEQLPRLDAWVGGESIDHLERKLRGKLAKPGRVLPTECDGTHHGEPADCRLHTTLFGAGNDQESGHPDQGKRKKPQAGSLRNDNFTGHEQEPETLF